MRHFEPKELDRRAVEALENQPAQKRITLYYVAVALGVPLLADLLTILLQLRIDQAGDSIAALQRIQQMETLQNCIGMLPSILTPFWTLGIAAVARRVVMGEKAGNRDLLAGFVCWKRVFTTAVVLGLYTVAVIYLCTILASILGIVVVFSDVGAVQSMVEAIVAEDLEAFATAMQLPFLLLLGEVASFFGMVFLFYRYRLFGFILLEDPAVPGIAILRRSRRLMAGRKRDFFRLDLHFWPYWLGMGVGCLLREIPLLETVFGFALPVSDMTLNLSILLGSTVVEFAAMYWGICRLCTASCMAYFQAKEEGERPKLRRRTDEQWDNYRHGRKES